MRVDARLAFGADERVVHAQHRLKLFVALAIWHENRFGDSESGQPRSMQSPDERARYDEATRGDLGLVQQMPESIEGAVTERDDVVTRGCVDVEAVHAPIARAAGAKETEC